ncbi:H(+)/Cl(-) exchange transporter 7-like [Lingula anatina]|uniref:Chloride channel protein n=1 Tax=Lingula anatina TaxID=7574 RepID=A0A1S3HA05_LINAN|nr:H(+)/Cl(-) exchange transporter 7-like [Lingula anatina]|eukprot:XP_013382838.1 H(+)/Cl(-) exchange transporter 7-like [Lingula anatina]
MLGDDEKTKMKEDNSEDKKETQTPRKGGKVKFTVTPVHLEDVAGPSDRLQNGEINQVCTPENTEDEASCDNESLTQNSITRILSSKFKDFKKYRESEKDEKTSNDPNSPQDKQKSPLLVSKRTRTAKPPPPAGKKRPDLIREESDLSDQLTTPDKVGTVVETSNKPQKYVTIAMQDWYPGDGQGDTITSAQSSITRLLSKKFRGFRKYVVESEQFAPEERPEVLKPMKRLVTTYEGLDYEINENSLFQEYQNSLEYKNIQWQWLSRWIVMFLIGFCTALVAVGVEMSVDYIVHYKFLALQTLTDECTDSQTPGCLAIPLVVWVVINCFCVVLGSALVTYLEPMATGSGIPQVKCYLNGIKMPGLMTIRALLAKAVGVVMSICGGLACGKEGPMIHSGAIVAAGISQGRARRCGRRYDPRIFKFLRSDHERRDFVSAGAAAGVAAAFGAPIGGVLFSLEEGASFWNQMLTWRMLFASMTATFSVNIILSAIHGNAADLSNPGLVSFGQFTDITYDTIEFPIFILMAVFGGLTGALFVRMNYHLSIFRRKFVRKKWLKVLEAVVIAAVSAVTAYFLVYTWHGCKDSLEKKDIHDDMGVKLFCDYAEKNEFSVIFFKSPEGSLKGMLHDENFEPGTLALLAVYFYFLTCWTYGLSVSSGVFIPCLLTGAAWGRLVGQGLHRLIPHLVQVGSGWSVGEREVLTDCCRHVMARRVVTLNSLEKVGTMIDMLKDRKKRHSGFPVVEAIDGEKVKPKTYGKLIGFMLRSQLTYLLREKGLSFSNGVATPKPFSLQDFMDAKSRNLPVESMLTDEERECVLDLKPFMNPSPFSVAEIASLPKVFTLFRGLGLRHLIVVNDDNEVKGIITRKDLAKYRTIDKKGKLNVVELDMKEW